MNCIPKSGQDKRTAPGVRLNGAFLCKKLTAAKFVVICRQNKGLQMTFDEVIQKLSEEKPRAKLRPTDLVNRLIHGIPYGYCEFNSPSLGHVTIHVTCDENMGLPHSDEISITVEYSSKCVSACNLSASEKSFNAGLDFIKTLTWAPKLWARLPYRSNGGR